MKNQTLFNDFVTQFVFYIFVLIAFFRRLYPGRHNTELQNSKKILQFEYFCINSVQKYFIFENKFKAKCVYKRNENKS
jgi:hypothetical protein